MKPKVIVIDDDSDMADFVRDAVIAQGFDAISMDRPEDFLTSRSRDCQILILDLFMPGVDGIEILRFLAKEKTDILLILMTGKDRAILSSAREMAYELNLTVLGTLEKPFKLAELEEIMNRYIGKERKESQKLPTVAELENAIAEKQLSVAYQPQVKITDRSVVGFEALARWRHPTKGAIPPGYFIGLAEQHGLISEIFDLITKIAIHQCGKWHSAGLEHSISINLSPKNLVDLSLPSKLEKMARDSKIKTRDIVLEVTETAVTKDVAKHIEILTRLRMKRFNLAIDDFGTGHSSLQQLIKVPFNELKIDQVFTKYLDSDAECQTITEVSILLAKKLGMRVVAEGIETEIVWNKLRKFNCDIGQGYWIGKPMRAEELDSWMTSWSSA